MLCCSAEGHQNPHQSRLFLNTLIASSCSAPPCSTGRTPIGAETSIFDSYILIVFSFLLHYISSLIFLFHGQTAAPVTMWIWADTTMFNSSALKRYKYVLQYAY